VIIIKGGKDKPKDFVTMMDWFERRTKNHIRFVQKYCGKIYKHDPKKFKGIIDRGRTHDESKFKEPELDPYVLIAWRYKCKRDKKDFAGYIGDSKAMEEAEKEMVAATEHHIKHNPHHPEYHTEQTGDLINKENRDKPPEKMIDATEMKDLDIGEMVADWCAMSEELADDPIKWADKNVNVRWKFTDEQKKLIYELIKAIWYIQ
jgi:hypothetical protein